MMTEIDGFIIEPHVGSCFLFQWMTEPQHTFKFEITSKRVTPIEVIPAAVAHGDPVVDAERFESKALEAAKKLKRQMFGSTAAA